MPTPAKDHPSLTLPSLSAWSQWLSASAETSNGVLLTLSRNKSTKHTTLTYEEARDEALCHGWIDSTGRGIDEHHRVMRFTPRRKGSIWSKHNIAHVERLDREGRMRGRGWDEVNAAKADGRWDAAYCQASNEPPADLLDAIAANPAAQAQWDVLNKSNRFAICFRLAALKNAKNRPGRIAKDVEMLARGETARPQKRKVGDGEEGENGGRVVKVEKEGEKKVKVTTAPLSAKKPTKTQAAPTPAGRRSARLRKDG